MHKRVDEVVVLLMMCVSLSGGDRRGEKEEKGWQTCECDTAFHHDTES
jgi:hypothetical protein